jgi:hypothetical protein
MKKLMLAACAVGAMIVPAVALPDLGNEEGGYSCDANKIERDVKSLVESMPINKIFGIHVLYVKKSSEVSRNSQELRCNIKVVLSNTEKADAVFKYTIEDGRFFNFIEFKNLFE